MRIEAPILGRERGRLEHRRQAGRVERLDAAMPSWRQRLVQHAAVPIDDHRRRRVHAVEQPWRERCRTGARRRRRRRGKSNDSTAQPRASIATDAISTPQEHRGRFAKLTVAYGFERPLGSQPLHLFPDLDHRRRRSPEHLGLVHLLRVRRRRAEGARRRRADDVGEDVAPFGEARREQLDAIVVALDVIEAAALPPGRPVARGSAASFCSCASDAADVANQDSTGSKPGGQRIGDRDEAALLGQVQRQRDADEIARLEGRRRRTACRSRRRARRLRSMRMPWSRPCWKSRSTA